MDDFKAEIEIDLDLRPPGTGESRDTVLPRCLEGSDDIILLVRAFQKDIRNTPWLHDQILVFLREMKRFFEPNPPRQLEQALTEWQEEFGEPAA